MSTTFWLLLLVAAVQTVTGMYKGNAELLRVRRTTHGLGGSGSGGGGYGGQGFGVPEIPIGAIVEAAQGGFGSYGGGRGGGRSGGHGDDHVHGSITHHHRHNDDEDDNDHHEHKNHRCDDDDDDDDDHDHDRDRRDVGGNYN